MEKKSERLEVRLGYEEKQTFTEACENQGDTPSGAVRRFINGYVRRSDADLLSSAWRGAAKRRGRRPLAFAAIFLAVGGAFWMLSQHLPIQSDEAIFSARDINGDGQLEYSEHAIPPGLNGAPNGVMRVLDLDASGTISRAEFTRKGRMVYVLGDGTASASSEEEAGASLVEFEFTKERAKTGTYVGAEINAQDLDRLVIWPDDGAPTVLEGEVDIAMGITGIELKSDTVITRK